MSVYSPRALASKDIDLIVPGITLSVLEKVRDSLEKEAKEMPTFDLHVSDYMGRRYPVGHVYMRHGDGFPVVIEFFQTFLGYDAARLAPFLTFRRKWGLRVQVLTPEAIVGTRLAFRPPERITAFNAQRLDRFVRVLGSAISWRKVDEFIDAFGLRALVEDNLAALRSKRISIAGSRKIRSAP